MNDVLTIEPANSKVLVKTRVPLTYDPDAMLAVEGGLKYLPVVRTKADPLEFTFDCTQAIPLAHILQEAVFEKDDAISFVCALLDQVCTTALVLPVIVHPDCVFLDAATLQISVCALPLALDAWMVRDGDFRFFTGYLLDHLQVKNAWDLSGCLYAGIKAQTCDPNTISAQLKTFKRARNGFFSFRKRESSHKDCALLQSIAASFALRFVSDRFENPPECIPLKKTSTKPDIQTVLPQLPAIPDPPVPPEAASVEKMHPQSMPERFIYIEPAEEETVLLNPDIELEPARIDIAGESFPLFGLEICIGRHLSNDLRLQDPSVSSMHARIIKEQNRFYIQDLKSSNGTFLDGRKVTRKMRLKNGMEVSFGNLSGIFYE
jgi:hypothetical protein